MTVSSGGKADPQRDKAQVLARRATHSGANIAQFVAFTQGTRGHITCITAMVRGDINRKPRSVEQGIEWLFDIGGAKYVNLRTYTLAEPEGNPFLLGVHHGFDGTTEGRARAAAQVRELLSQGYRVIINENIDTTDGISGVMFDGVVEFAPSDTPRCVEEPGVAALAVGIFQAMVFELWGIHFALPQYSTHDRVEFSVHPRRVGLFNEHIVIWEDRRVLGETAAQVVFARWPNAFSRAFGDKPFGLLIAHILGEAVPRTYVDARAFGIIEFGTPVPQMSDLWWRTAPRDFSPGILPTTSGPFDRYDYMASDPNLRDQVASFLWQQGAMPVYSGACITTSANKPHFEGVHGQGEDFMQGQSSPERLSIECSRAVRAAWSRLTLRLNGPVKFEWVYDGCTLWIVQLHVIAALGSGDIIVAGNPTNWLDFPFGRPLDELRERVAQAAASGKGIRLVGDFAITCHAGDICRRAQVPTRRVLPH